jgi:hypothetical protein
MRNKVFTLAVAGGLLYAARRYYLNWGTTKGECGMGLPGDELVKAPVIQTTEGVWIDAPASVVWPWLVQMGQGRGGLYTDGTLEDLMGLDSHSADRIHPEWQHLAIGDEMRLAPTGWMGLHDGISLNVADVIEQRAIVLRASTSKHLWDGVWSFHLIPHWEDRCRLLFRTRNNLRHPGDFIVVESVGPAKALLTREMLLGIKRRAESQVQGEASAAKASGSLHRTV